MRYINPRYLLTIGIGREERGRGYSFAICKGCRNVQLTFGINSLLKRTFPYLVNSSLLSQWTGKTTFGVSSPNLCYAIKTTIVHISQLCFNYCDYANLSILMYLFYILCSGSCKSSAALCVLLIVLSHENIYLFLASTLNDDERFSFLNVKMLL